MGDHKKTVKLILLSSQVQTQKIYELSEGLYTIGRGEDQNICIPDSTVSQLHCELILNEDGGYRVQDLESSNGTRINGTKISEQILNHSDILQVGGIEILYHCENEVIPESIQNGYQADANVDTMEHGVPIEEIPSVNPFKNDGKKSDNKKLNLAIRGVLFALLVAVIALVMYLILHFYS